MALNSDNISFQKIVQKMLSTKQKSVTFRQTGLHKHL